MPELPEVETVRRDLEAHLLNTTIESIAVLHAKSVKNSADDFCARLQGQSFIAFERQGKLLQCRLSSGEWLLVHLKMTGQCIVRRDGRVIGGGGHPSDIDDLSNNYTRIILRVTNGATFFFNDMRIFGWMWVATQAERDEYTAHLGSDAYLAELSPSEIQDYCKKYPKRNLKQLLLDQSFIAGVGNIYADEIAFFAGLLPDRQLSLMTSDNIVRVLAGIKEIIPRAVSYRGTSFRNFVDGDGQKGGYLPLLKAYGRAGLPCVTCKTPLERTRVAQRGTTFCPQCQV